ncbi:MAG: hypothetical protein JNL76_02900 [Alphaproteobacteria bacterium]|nr:hypothetical protein [Alphaproteobacteria bacterium]
MGSQDLNDFNLSGAVNQPQEMALSYADIIKIFQLTNLDLYDENTEEEIEDLRSLVINLISQMSLASARSQKYEIDTIRSKIIPDSMDFLIAFDSWNLNYSTSSPIKSFGLLIGSFCPQTTPQGNTIAIPTLNYGFIADFDVWSLRTFSPVAVWKEINSDNLSIERRAQNINEIYASLCYANELFVQIITGQVLNNDSIKAAQAWFKKTRWDHTVQIGICLDRQPNAIFNAGAEIIYKQQMGERPQDIYPAPERKQ